MTDIDKASLSDKSLEKIISRHFLDLFIRIGLLGFLVVYCYQIFKPLIGMMLWSIILAVAFYPLQAAIVRKWRIRPGWAATLLVSAIIVGVLVPVTLLTVSFADSTTAFIHQVHAGSFQIPEPNPSVATWPLVGQGLFSLWSSAHDDMGGLLTELAPKIGPITKQILGYAASATSTILKFVVSLVLAGIWMAYAEASHASAKAIARRIAGPESGDGLVKLSTTTIRAIAQGVIGIACIQALLLGAGFFSVGIPAAGVLALLTLVLGIVQIPALLIALPAIIYVFSTNPSTPIALVFTVYTLLAGSVDNVLKPLLLGRGVDAPMPVILLGALGGLAAGGIIGLFLGPVMLALGYQLFTAWVRQGQSEN